MLQSLAGKEDLLRRPVSKSWSYHHHHHFLYYSFFHDYYYHLCLSSSWKFKDARWGRVRWEEGPAYMPFSLWASTSFCIMIFRHLVLPWWAAVENYLQTSIMLGDLFADNHPYSPLQLVSFSCAKNVAVRSSQLLRALSSIRHYSLWSHYYCYKLFVEGKTVKGGPKLIGIRP